MITQEQHRLVVERYEARILQLESIIDGMDEELDTEPSKDLSDEEVAQFLENFKQSLEGFNYAQLEFLYPRSVLSEYSASVRYLMAVTLVNWCSQKKASPLTYWTTLVARQGEH